MQLKLSAKKLAFVIPAVLVVLFAGALALAKTGHFEPLAKFLNIKADVATLSAPSNYTLCVMLPQGAESEYAGVYSKIDRTVADANNGGIPYYQKDNHYLYAYPDLVYSNGIRWILNKTLDNPQYASKPYTSPGCVTIAGCANGPSNNAQFSWAASSVLLLGKTGTMDPKTCLPVGGIDGAVQDNTGALISGATVTINGKNLSQTTSDSTGETNYQFSNLSPGNYELTASKEGYTSVTKEVTVVESQVSRLDFVLVLNPPNQNTLFKIMGRITDPNAPEGRQLLKDVNVKVYNNETFSITPVLEVKSVDHFLSDEPGELSHNYTVNIPSLLISQNPSLSFRIVFEKDGYVVSEYSLVPNANNMIKAETGVDIKISKNNFYPYVGSSQQKYLVAPVHVYMEPATTITGHIYDSDDKLYKEPRSVALKVGGFDRNNFDESFADPNIPRVTSEADVGTYRFTFTSEEFLKLTNGLQTVDVEICMEVLPGGLYYACYQKTLPDLIDSVLGLSDNGVPKVASLLTVERGKIYQNIDIHIKIKPDLKKIQFLDAITGAPIDLTRETALLNYLQCIDRANKPSNCVFKSVLDETDPTHSTYIYHVKLNKGDTLQHTVDYNLAFYTANYELLPSPQQIPIDGITKVYLTPRNNLDGAFYCEEHGGIWFVSYAAERNGVFTPQRRAIMDQMGRLFTQISVAANLNPRPAFFVMNYRGQAWPLKNIPANCFKDRYVFGLSKGHIDNMIIPEWAHEIGHVVAHGLKPEDNSALQNNFKAGQGSNCNEIFGSRYPCFSNYALQTNQNELWAEFFKTYVTNMDKINDFWYNPPPTTDPNYNSYITCKKILADLLVIMKKRFPDMPVFGKSADVISMSQPKASNVLGVTATSVGFDKSALISIMKELGYSEVTPPEVKTSISYDAVLSLTPTQILAGKWLQENYEKLTPIQKANFQLGVISSQITTWANTNTAISYIRTQITNMASTIESWLGALGYKFTSSRLAGTLLDQNGLAVAGFKVTVGNAAGQGKFDVTNSTGSFSIPRLPTGSQTITVTDPKDNKVYPVFDYYYRDRNASQFTVKPDTKYSKFLMIQK